MVSRARWHLQAQYDAMRRCKWGMVGGAHRSPIAEEVGRGDDEYLPRMTCADDRLQCCNHLQRLAEPGLISQQPATTHDCTKEPPHTVDLMWLEDLQRGEARP
jgi:hypothetical protein